MNVLLITEDKVLTDMLAQKGIRGRDVLIVASDADNARRLRSEMEIDVIILSDRMTDVDRLPCERSEALNGTGSGVQKILLLSNRHHAGHNGAALKEALSEGWETIPPGLTVRQVSDRIGQLIYGETDDGKGNRRNGIIQFVGTTPNIGVTVAAFGTAALLAAMTGKSVAYLCLNLKSSKIHAYLGDREPSVTLDGLRAELRSCSLTGERLLRQGRRQKRSPNLSVFYGNVQREQADYYTLEEIECLLRKANEVFDYCVVETSAYWDNAGTIGTLRQADQRLLVVTPQLSHFQEDWCRWFGTLSSVFNLTAADFDLVVTQSEADALYRTKDIAKETGMSRIGELRKYKELDSLLAAGRIAEAFADGRPLGADCERLARALLTIRGEPYAAKKESNRRVKGWVEWNPIRFAGRRIGFVRK